MGGTIFRMTPEAVGALVGLRDRLTKMGQCVTWARALAAALPSYGIGDAALGLDPAKIAAWIGELVSPG